MATDDGADATGLKPPRPNAPSLSNWGVFGDDDELGTLNYLTPAAVLAAIDCVKEGRPYPLNLPLDQPTPRPIGRPELKRVMNLHNWEWEVQNVIVNDDSVEFATQGSSQWDALIHTGCREPGVTGVFYNGVETDSVDELGFAHKNSIENFAKRGIAGRGVLLDVARMVNGGTDQELPNDYIIGVDETLACIRHQGIEMRSGDIVCIRTGWTDAYMNADADGREALTTAFDDRGVAANPGIDPDHAVIAHEQRWAAVAADNLAVEYFPNDTNRQNAHITMQRNLGLPFGELFWFWDLSRAAARDQRWDFLFVAVPLWIPGGAGSPANALAIR